MIVCYNMRPNAGPICFPRSEERGEDFRLTGEVGVKLNYLTASGVRFRVGKCVLKGRVAEARVVEKVDTKSAGKGKSIRYPYTGGPRGTVNEDKWRR
jgi:hypothetical protein